MGNFSPLPPFLWDTELQGVEDLPFVIIVEEGENSVTEEKNVEEPSR